MRKPDPIDWIVLLLIAVITIILLSGLSSDQRRLNRLEGCIYYQVKELCHG